MNALSTITAMPVTYQEIGSFVQRVKAEILSGEYDPLTVEIHLKAMEETIKLLRGDEEIKNEVIKEALKHGEKQFDYHGVKMQVRDSGVKWDYAATQDSEWAILDAEATEISEKKKAREKFLQAIPAEGTVSPTTGEMIYPPSRSAKTTIFVTLK
jgi:hypothetical protein